MKIPEEIAKRLGKSVVFHLKMAGENFADEEYVTHEITETIKTAIREFADNKS